MEVCQDVSKRNSILEYYFLVKKLLKVGISGEKSSEKPA